jgi:2-octaprenyl-6-methoxyphenol hydroxylase
MTDPTTGPSSPLNDAVIIGGGLVGASLALALGQAGLRVVVIEAHPLDTEAQPSFDDRALALAWGSRLIFEALEVWPDIATEAEPIRRIHVSDRGRFGATRMSAEEEGVQALGYVVVARAVGRALMARLSALESVSYRSPARFRDLRIDVDRVTVRVEGVDGSEELAAQLLIAADGARSPVREALGIGERVRDYGQTAVTTNVLTAAPQTGLAFERFAESGPVAMLPMREGRYGVVWTVEASRQQEVMGLADEAFAAALQRHFGYRLGRILRVGRRSAYPLVQVLAEEQVGPRAVIIGNAAHALHPVAAQGFNLSLRDVATLAELIVDAVGEGADPGEAAVLERYLARRRNDHRAVTGFSDLLVALFSNRLPGLAQLRGLGLVAVDLVGPLRHGLARRAMGLGRPAARLARGLADRSAAR